MVDKPHISLQSAQNITELKEFTKILEQNTKFKKPVLTHKNSLLTSTNKREPPFRKCTSTTNDQRSSNVNDLSNSPIVLDDDDDDLIPPTPSPVRQQSFVTCVDHRSSLSTKLPQTHSSFDVLMADTSCNSSTVVGKVRETNSLARDTPSIVIANEQSSSNLQTCNDKTVSKEQHLPKISGQDTKDQKVETTENAFLNKSGANNNNNYCYKNLNISSFNFEESSPTLTTSRKKYKISRKPKPPKLLASPLKKLENCHTKSLLRNKLPLKKVVEQPNQEESSCDNTPSKCGVLRSRMKRPPTKGASPLQKRLQTEVVLYPIKVIMGCLPMPRLKSAGHRVKISCFFGYDIREMQNN